MLGVNEQPKYLEADNFRFIFSENGILGHIVHVLQIRLNDFTSHLISNTNTSLTLVMDLGFSFVLEYACHMYYAWREGSTQSIAKALTMSHPNI